MSPPEYAGSVLSLSTVAYEMMFELPYSWIQPYVFAIVPTMRQAALDPTSVGWGMSVRPPGQHFAGYHVFRTEMTDLERRAWLSRLKVSMQQGIQIEDLPPYRGFERWNTNIPRLRRIASDGEHVVLVPETASGSPVTASHRRRFQRLVQTAQGVQQPYHCFHSDALLLVDGLPPGDLVFATFRTDDGTFGSNSRVPAGARAAALTFRLNDAARAELTGPRYETVTATASADSPVTSTNSSGSPERDTIATPPAAELGVRVVFPDGGVDADAVRDHVSSLRIGSGSAAFGFEEPTVDRAGRVVAVSETIPLAVRR